MSIAAGGDEWRGKLPPSAENPSESAVVLRLVAPTPDGLVLRGKTAVPECGFCKFMKAGPCGEEFQAWEACIDRARDSKEDFVEVCGKPTLRLKDCTDKHPEYYGVLGDSSSEQAEQTEQPADEAPPAAATEAT